MNKPKIAIIVSAPFTITSFLLAHIKALSEIYEVTIIANSPEDVFEKLPISNAFNVPIQRKISLLLDLKSLYILYKIFSREKFDAVQSLTPKAGLLSMLAAFFAGTQFRFHYFIGQVWATRSGFNRRLLKSLDKLTFTCATDVLVDSHSQRDFLIKENVVNSIKSNVLANGSLSGVNLERFSMKEGVRIAQREKWGVLDTDVVILFMGRKCIEKGLQELLTAYNSLIKDYDNLYLALIGPNEGIFTDEFFQQYSELNVIVEGYTDTPEVYYSASDIFVLPSHREGFGSVVIEAAAAGIPSIGSSIYGLSDAIVEGVTGLLHTPKDPVSLEIKLKEFISDERKRKMFGNAALRRAQEMFSEELVVDKFRAFYLERIPNK